MKTGKVIIAGAGTGDPELLTLKAARYLGLADVVLTDRLVSEEILLSHIGRNTELIYVGKQCRKGLSTSQEVINELLVKHAGMGKLVVRLKGGDVSVFSNIMDELIALNKHAIPYEIIPGITAACGAAAYAGIPLTARGYSTAVRFLTYHTHEQFSDEYLQNLAHTEDTLVFYMSSEILDTLIAGLKKNGIDPDMNIAVVEQATTPFQRVHTSTVGNYNGSLKGETFSSPSLVIIGKVVALHKQFSWVKNCKSRLDYFKPITPFSHSDTTPQYAYSH